MGARCLLEEKPATSSTSFGRSEEGRPLSIRLLKSEADGGRGREALRVLLVAGQHGDEPLARSAAERFEEALLARRLEITTAPLTIAILADANPDGSRRGQRHNARGIDLNRDHQRLEAAETRALHELVRAWRPELVIDLHTYPPRRRHLSERRLAYCHDVFVAGPTHPACLPAQAREQSEDLVDSVIGGVREAGLRCQRYTLVRPRGRIRFSTLETHDLRNWLSLRYGVQTLLLEGRQPAKRDAEGAKRVEEGLVTALFQACRWAAGRPLKPAPSPTPGEEIPLRCAYAADGTECRLELQDLESGQIRPVPLPEEFRPAVRVRSSARLPRAYAVPHRERPVLQMLRRHGIAGRHWALSRPQRVEAFRIRHLEGTDASRRGKRRLVGTFEQETTFIDDYLVFPITHEGGRALATLLEPKSRAGLARWDLLDLEPGDLYPVLRVL